MALDQDMAEHFLELLSATLAVHRDRCALIYGGRAYSYAELGRCGAAAAGVLTSHGLVPGDRVALWTPAKFPFLLAHLGVLAAGGVALPLNPRFTRGEMRHFLKDSAARLAIVSAEQAKVLVSLREELPELQAVIEDDAFAAGNLGDAADSQSPRFPERGVSLEARRVSEGPPDLPHSCVGFPASADDPCLLVYSSGTTGWPKGVVHTQANLAAALRALQECWRISEQDVVVNVLPLFHIHGLAFATLLPLMAGACVLIEDAFEPAATMAAIGRGTVFMAVPTIYYRLLEQPEFPALARSWSGVRLFTCGSAPIRAEVLPELEGILGKPVINRYGMTEAHVITSLPLAGPWPQGSVGVPLRGVELRIMDDAGAEVARGEVGHVHIRGPNLFREYWRNPEATRKAFATGWFATGDLGSLDERGYLTLVGRSNDLIITNGYNVYPQVVERIINDCPGVRECAVVGVADERRGESVAAAVVRSDAALDEQRLQDYLSERLVDYQRPRKVLFVDELPRNAMGKVLRTELKSRLALSS